MPPLGPRPSIENPWPIGGPTSDTSVKIIRGVYYDIDHNPQALVIDDKGNC